MSRGQAIGLGLGLAAIAWGLSARASSSPTASSRRGAFRDELVKRAREDIGRVIETSRNDGPIVRQYLANVGAGPGENWCAAAVWTWIRDAALRSGSKRVLEIIPATGMAKALADGPKRVGWWKPVRGEGVVPLMRPPEGSLAIWDRSDPPGSSWQGHVGVIESWVDDQLGAQWFRSLEGNSGVTGDRVTRMERPLIDPRLLGFVVFPEDL
jgi:hypothetical protein